MNTSLSWQSSSCDCRFTFDFVDGWDYLWCPRCEISHESQQRHRQQLPWQLDRALGRLEPPIGFLRYLGIHVGLDWDGEVEITFDDDSPSNESLRALLLALRPKLKKALEGKRQYESAVLVGGPLNGERYGSMRWDGHVFRKVGRAEWVVYRVQDWRGNDRRAFFIGRTTSEAKCRAMAARAGHAS